MSLLFIQYWDVIRGREKEYTDYLNNTYLAEVTTTQVSCRWGDTSSRWVRAEDDNCVLVGEHGGYFQDHNRQGIQGPCRTAKYGQPFQQHRARA